VTAPGEGALRFVRSGARTVLHTARARSPLKLLLPQNHGHGAWVYLASFGGGLVDGDAVALTVDVERGGCVVIGTQASTKVYRSPRGTTHHVSAHVATDALLALVPDPVSCFAGSRYQQHVDVRLENESASLVLVDSLTCGRVASGERWALARYASRIQVSMADRVIAMDAALLDPEQGDVATRMGRFDALTTIVVAGPRARVVREAMLASSSTAPSSDASLLRSATPLGSDAALGRIAASSAQEAAAAVRALLVPLAGELGDDPFRRRW
jgi:urease accessory protein